MRIKLQLYGVYRSAIGSENIILEPSQAELTVRAAIAELLSRPGYEGLRQLILDGASSDPRSNSMILVCGREIGALEGLDTKLKENDELSLLPIAHGG